MSIQTTAVGILRDDGDGGLCVEWLLEGGTAELYAGQLLVIPEDESPWVEDGTAYVEVVNEM